MDPNAAVLKISTLFHSWKRLTQNEGISGEGFIRQERSPLEPSSADTKPKTVWHHAAVSRYWSKRGYSHQRPHANSRWCDEEFAVIRSEECEIPIHVPATLATDIADADLYVRPEWGNDLSKPEKLRNKQN